MADEANMKEVLQQVDQEKQEQLNQESKDESKEKPDLIDLSDKYKEEESDFQKYLDKGAPQTDQTEEKQHEAQPEQDDEIMHWTKKDAYK